MRQRINNMEELDSIRKKQATIDRLLENGDMLLGKAGIANHWVLDPLYQGKDCSVGFVHISTVELGSCAEHVHPESLEYLIVAKGSILLNIDGKDVRVVGVGECASIPKGSKHFSRPLEDDTKLIYVCVPTDPYLPKVMK